MINGWKYYNHAAIPTVAPHVAPNIGPICDGSIWKDLDGGSPLLARWTSDFDCGYMTNWWYVIKDTPFDINSLKAKRRYEINKGKKNYYVKAINPADYSDGLYRTTVLAYSSWPEKYRPSISEESFKGSISKWKTSVVIAAFNREENELCGYAVLEEHDDYVAFTILRVRPEDEKFAINAAIVNEILEHYFDRFDGRFYICDGERSIRHETAFQDYLEKYFEFRKAYCKLNIAYRPGFAFMVKTLYPMRRIIKGKTRIGSQIHGIMNMEEIRRSFNKQEK